MFEPSPLHPENSSTSQKIQHVQEKMATLIQERLSHLDPTNSRHRSLIKNLKSKLAEFQLLQFQSLSSDKLLLALKAKFDEVQYSIISMDGDLFLRSESPEPAKLPRRVRPMTPLRNKNGPRSVILSSPQVDILPLEKSYNCRFSI
ncbi:MAG TPA: hypothetical protein VJ205_05025 [Gammaproteobacteria bacterium]|nr:hypothetical protein [Gammaproteobacteria bacterium]